MDIPGNTFPRELRLTQKADYDRVFRDGRHCRNGLFLLICAANGLDRSRMGLVVSRKFGGAVKRNRLKRLCREAFRLSRRTLPAGLDFVVLPKARPEAYTLEKVTDSLRTLLSDAWQRLEM